MDAALSPSDRNAVRPKRLPRQRGRIRLRTIVFIRWIAVAGQLATLLFVHLGMGYPLPLLWAMATVGALAVVTIGAQIRRSASHRLTDRESALYFAFDMVQLSVLLFLTGGLNNPFAILILAPVTVSATTLSYRSTLGLSALAITCINLLAVFHLPLPWSEEGYALAPNYVMGFTIALGLAVIFIASYVYRVAQESRRLSDALAATQAALDREQSLSSLGALAAAAAHELGSPLGTISLVARELQREIEADDPIREDIDLLVSQSARCREILAELSRRPEEQQQADHFNAMPAPLLIELAAEGHRRPEVVLRIEENGDPADPVPPLLPRRPELLHGLGNLLQNAIEFAREEVKVAIAWNAAEIAITISDDGVGFPPDLLDRLGDPYLSQGAGLKKTMERKGDHMGLGVFIAQQLIERSGGSVSFSNNAYGGAEVVATWPRNAFEGASSHE